MSARLPWRHAPRRPDTCRRKRKAESQGPNLPAEEFVAREEGVRGGWSRVACVLGEFWPVVCRVAVSDSGQGSRAAKGQRSGGAPSLSTISVAIWHIERLLAGNQPGRLRVAIERGSSRWQGNLTSDGSRGASVC